MVFLSEQRDPFLSNSILGSFLHRVKDGTSHSSFCNNLENNTGRNYITEAWALHGLDLLQPGSLLLTKRNLVFRVLSVSWLFRVADRFLQLIIFIIIADIYYLIQSRPWSKHFVY